MVKPIVGSDTVSGNVSCDASCPLVDKPDILHVSYMTPYHVTTRCPVNTCIPRLYLLIHSCSVCWCPYVLHHFFLAKPCGNVTQCTCIQFSCAVFLSAVYYILCGHCCQTLFRHYHSYCRLALYAFILSFLPLSHSFRVPASSTCFMTSRIRSSQSPNTRQPCWTAADVSFVWHLWSYGVVCLQERHGTCM